MTYVEKSVHRQLGQWVYESVRQKIIGLAFPPGMHLREAELAGRYKVSKTPVREALLQLKKDGLVDITSYRGAVVTHYTVTDLVEIYDLRELLEGSCAREAAQLMPVDDLVELGRIVRVSEESLDSGNVDLLPDLFNSFDEIIYRQTRNGRIVDLLTYLDGNLRRIGNLSVGIPGRLDKSVRQHIDIYDAIAIRNPDEAERRMRQHVRSVLADQVATFQVHAGNSEI